MITEFFYKVVDLAHLNTLYINDQKMLRGNFTWQDGYGAFLYSRSHLSNIYEYIQDQKIHHLKRTFKEEYMEMLKKFDIEYKEEYLLSFLIKVFTMQPLRGYCKVYDQDIHINAKSIEW